MFCRVFSAFFRRWTLESLLAARLLHGRKGAYVSLITSISVLGLALGVASLVVILSVTSGFEHAFRDKLLGVYPHLVVIGKGGEVRQWGDVLRQLEGMDGVRFAAPATYDEMMASRRSSRAGTIVKGVDFSFPGNHEMIEQFLVEGDLSELEPPLVLEASADASNVYQLRTPSGGMTAVMALTGQPKVKGIPVYIEDPSSVVLVNATDTELVGRIPGLLETREVRLAPGAVSQPLTTGPSGVALTLGGEYFTLDAEAAGSAFILYREAEQPLKGSACKLPAPGAVTEPAHLCFVNATPELATLRLAGSTLELQPGAVDSAQVAEVTTPGVILGEELARRIEAAPGDEIRLVSPLSTLSGLSSQSGKGRTIADTFRVVGLVHLGFYEYDAKLAIVGFDAARRFLHQGDVARWVEIRIDDLFQSGSSRIDVGRRLRNFTLLDLQDNLPGLKRKFIRAADSLKQEAFSTDALESIKATVDEVRFSDVDGSFGLGVSDEQRIITWEEMNEPLFTSMKRQKIVLSLFFLIVIMVAAFNVVSSQVMVVREKGPEISMLKAMGAERGQIRRAFLWQGMVVGGFGVACGMVLAAAVCLFLKYVGFPLDPQVYFVARLPVSLVWTDYLWSSSLALGLVYLSISIAARRASNLTPVEGLRNLE